MKKALLCLLVVFTFNTITNAQGYKRISSLYGFESNDYTTHLIYGTEEGYDPVQISNYNFYHHNTANNSDTLKFRGHYFLPPNYPTNVGELVKGFYFLDNDPDKYIYILNEYDIDAHGKVIRYDNPLYFSNFYPLSNLWVDKNNQNNIYVKDEYSIFPSSTGGSDWGNYKINYSPTFLSANPYNCAMIFGIMEGNKLYRSVDTGRTNNIVSNEFSWSKDSKLYFDNDGHHIYGVAGNSLVVSPSSGAPYSWYLLKEFAHPVILSTDEYISGTFYIADGRNLYCSANYGLSISLITTFDRVITGIYKKPNQPVIYLAFKHKIISVDNSGNIIPDFKITIPIDKYLSLYPLKVGNSWTYKTEYHDYSVSNPYSYTVYNRLSIDSEAYFDSIKYYKFSDNSYQRIDPETGFVLRRNTSGEDNKESIIFDLAWVEGDTSDFSGSKPSIIEVDEIMDSSLHFKKTFYYAEGMLGWVETYLEGVGRVSSGGAFDFGSLVNTLMGYVINGVVYGDTTLVGVEDEINNKYNYSLSQNYPNPFNPVTNINFNLQKAENVTLKVFDILGKEVATLVYGELTAGSHAVQFDGANLSSGLYIYQLKTDNYFAAKKMLLIK